MNITQKRQAANCSLSPFGDTTYTQYISLVNILGVLSLWVRVDEKQWSDLQNAA
jgi:hypothetical protein